MKTLPVYVISGLLESGKTTFIKSTIASDDFYKKGKTLVFACEEGEVEYDKEFLDKYNTEVIYFDNQEDFTSLKLQEITVDKSPARLVIELNGMWDLTKIAFPTYFKIYQFINFINFETFPIYFMNMRQRYLDFVKQADVVVFNRVEGDLEKLKPYASAFKLANSNAQFMEMDSKGRLQDAFEVELPYDLEADIVKIKEEDYGTYYIDSFDHKEKYEGKTVEFTVMAIVSDRLPKNTFIAGRLAMTCCSNDIQLYGHLCINNASFKIKDRMWVHIIATIKYEWSDEYNEEELVLYPVSITKAKGPKEEILDLTK